MSQTQSPQDPTRKLIVPTAAGSAQLNKLKETAAESWMHPGKVLLAGIVVSLIIGLILYYTATTFLQVTSTTVTSSTTSAGLFATSNWLTIGGGALFLFLVAMILGLGGATIGMSWKNNGQAALWTMGATALLGVIYYFVFVSAKEDRKDQFALWSVLATIVAIALPGYGWWQAKAMADGVKGGAYDDSLDKTAIPRRASWAMFMFGGAAILALVVAFGLWTIYSNLA